jgi:hypothetical protein
VSLTAEDGSLLDLDVDAVGSRLDLGDLDIAAIYGDASAVSGP